eukprot:4054863-Amphidinium_carterae.1
MRYCNRHKSDCSLLPTSRLSLTALVTSIVTTERNECKQGERGQSIVVESSVEGIPRWSQWASGCELALTTDRAHISVGHHFKRVTSSAVRLGGAVRSWRGQSCVCETAASTSWSQRR